MHLHLVERAMAGDHGVRGAGARRIGRLYAIAVLILRDPARPRTRPRRRSSPPGATCRRLRDPDRFDAWLPPDSRSGPATASPGSRASPRTIDVNVRRSKPRYRGRSGRPADPDEIERGFRRLDPEQRTVMSCTTSSASRPPEWPMPSAFPWGPRSRGSTGRPGALAIGDRCPTQRGMHLDEGVDGMTRRTPTAASPPGWKRSPPARA